MCWGLYAAGRCHGKGGHTWDSCCRAAGAGNWVGMLLRNLVCCRRCKRKGRNDVAGPAFAKGAEQKIMHAATR